MRDDGELLVIVLLGSMVLEHPEMGWLGRLFLLFTYTLNPLLVLSSVITPSVKRDRTIQNS